VAETAAAAGETTAAEAQSSPRVAGAPDDGAEVVVRYFAAAADAAGRDEERLTVAPATAGALRELLVARHGAPMERVLARGSFLVDGLVTRDPERALGARVDVLPPFTGG